jgi:hypothetical protein
VNNSSIRVATSMRGGTLQYLHISEYGKLCARFPEKAREVRTGALNTLQAGNVVFIESTAEGQEGHFYELCDQAQSRQRMGAELSPLDFKFHFYPWWRSPDYALKPTGATTPENYVRYFEKLSDVHGIALSEAQRAWYVAKAETQVSDQKREYPSTPEEAFEAAVEGAIFGDAIAQAEREGRIGEFKAHEGVAVQTAWDIGVSDSTAIWFFQVAPDLRRRFVGYYEASGEGMDHYVNKVRAMASENGWTLGNVHFPHDAYAREWSTGRTRAEVFQEVTKSFPRRVPDESVQDGIEAARIVLRRSEFDEAACSEGLKALRAYRREWNEEMGIWRDKPRHDWSSHAADAYRYAALVTRDPRPVEPPKPKPDLLDAPNTMAWRPGIGTSLTIDMVQFLKQRERQRKMRA